MNHPARHKLGAYDELYSASSIVIVGSGIITASMGEFLTGASFVLSGIAVGLGAPLVRFVHNRKIANRR